jgi:hypothetical protein
VFQLQDTRSTKGEEMSSVKQSSLESVAGQLATCLREYRQQLTPLLSLRSIDIFTGKPINVELPHGALLLRDSVDECVRVIADRTAGKSYRPQKSKFLEEVLWEGSVMTINFHPSLKLDSLSKETS